MSILAALLLAVLPASAHEEGAADAGPGAEFLRIGVSARAAAMGEAQAAFVDDASALYFNPAALTRVEKRSATFMHASYIESTSLNYASYAQKLGARGAIGASVQHMAAGAIEAIDDASLTTGEFKPHDVALALGAARRLGGGELDGFAVGVSAKLVRSTIRDTAQTVAADAGVLTPAYFGRRLRLGASLSNLGGKLRYSGEENGHALPRIARLGAAYRASERWSLALDGVRESEDAPYLNAGTEYRVPRANGWTFAVRAGLSSRDVADVDRALGLAGGFGADFKAFGLDYAFLPMGAFGTAHRVSLNFTF